MHAVGWLAVAVALTVVIPTRAGRVAAVVVGAMLAVVIGLCRTYLRAHHLTDVLAGEALATAIYALAAVAAVMWRTRHRASRCRETSSSS